MTELALIEWFPAPLYPDNDPLTVKINLLGTPAKESGFLFLQEIDPARVLFELVGKRPDSMFVMRIEGLDLML